MRLIDADALVLKLDAIGGCDADPKTWSDGWDKAIAEAIRLTDKAPPIEAEPVKHGRWINYPEHENFRCSLCRIVYRQNGTFNYCPYCGAKMDGEE